MTQRTLTTGRHPVMPPRVRRYACPTCDARWVFEMLDGTRIPPHDGPDGKLCEGGGRLPVVPRKED